jgi:hypothetical protein
METNRTAKEKQKPPKPERKIGKTTYSPAKALFGRGVLTGIHGYYLSPAQKLY